MTNRIINLLVINSSDLLHNSYDIKLYIAHRRRLSEDLKILSVGKSKSDTNDPPSDFLDIDLLTALPFTDIAERAFLAVQEVLKNYEIKEIEFFDSKGIGARIVQAKIANVIPNQIQTRVICFGGHLFRPDSYCSLKEEDMKTLSYEKTAILKADQVIFSSEYVRAAYHKIGIRPKSATICLPYVVDKLLDNNPNLSQSTELIVFGSHKEVVNSGLYDQLLKKLGAGSYIESISFLNLKKQKVKNMHVSSLSVEFKDLCYLDALDYIKSNGQGSIVLIANSETDSAYKLIELAMSANNLIVFKNQVSSNLFCGEIFSGLILKNELDATLHKLSSVYIKSLQENYAKVKLNLVNSLKKNNNFYRRPLIQVASQRSSLSVCGAVTIYNTDRDLLYKCLESISTQSYKMDQFIVVNDGSSKACSEDIISFCDTLFGSDYTYVFQENAGLSAARNKALSLCTSDLFIPLDSDDCFYQDFVAILRDAHSFNPKITSFCCYVRFNHINRDVDQAEIEEIYSPWGSDMGWVFGAKYNRYALAFSMFKSEHLKEVQGWCSPKSAMWEDWRLNLKLDSKTYESQVVPKVLIDYSVHTQSMSRTYDVFGAQQNIITELKNTLPNWEAESLFRVLHTELEIDRTNTTYLSLVKLMLFTFKERNLELYNFFKSIPLFNKVLTTLRKKF